MDPLFLLFPPLSLPPQVFCLNFSSVTTPELLLKTFGHSCDCKSRGHTMELLWHLLNSGNSWSSSVMRLTHKTLINIMVRWREDREWRDETREWQKRRNGG